MKQAMIFLLLLTALFTDAQKLSTGAEILFKGVKTKLSIADKNDIFLQTAYHYIEEKKALYPSPDTSSLMDTSLFKIKILPTDLNKDGIQEIFMIIYINSDEGISAFIKRNGKYVKSDIFYFDEPYFLDSKSFGYNDIESGGSNYRYDGIIYKPFKGKAGKKLKKIEAYSHDYVAH